MRKKAAADKEGTFAVRNTTKGKLVRLPFERMKDTVLGKDYTLSLVFAGDTLTRKLNRIYRGKDKPANVLSFPLSPTSGEVFINPSRARKEASKFGETFPSFVGFLFIHGLLHLKGMAHGSKMESEERNIRKKFGL